MTCKDDGSWDEPDVWDRCYDPSERTCSDPPSPAFNGGLYDWQSGLYSGGRTPYATEVTYSCGAGRKIFTYDENDNITTSDSQKLACQWTRIWEPTKVCKKK